MTIDVMRTRPHRGQARRGGEKIRRHSKQHFEKVILIAALVGLGVAVFYLYGETQKRRTRFQSFFRTSADER